MGQFKSFALGAILIVATACQGREPQKPDWHAEADRLEEEKRRIDSTTRDVSQLIRMIESGDPDEQVRAAAAFRSMGTGAEPAIPQLIGLLKTPSGRIPGDAAHALANIGAPAVPALVEALASPSKAVRDWVAEPLANIGLPAEQPLIRALHDPRREVRVGAARILGHLNECTAASAEALHAALSDPDEEVRRVADDSLARVRSHLAWVENQKQLGR